MQDSKRPDTLGQGARHSVLPQRRHGHGCLQGRRRDQDRGQGEDSGHRRYARRGPRVREARPSDSHLHLSHPRRGDSKAGAQHPRQASLSPRNHSRRHTRGAGERRIHLCHSRRAYGADPEPCYRSGQARGILRPLQPAEQDKPMRRLRHTAPRSGYADDLACREADAEGQPPHTRHARRADRLLYQCPPYAAHTAHTHCRPCEEDTGCQCAQGRMERNDGHRGPQRGSAGNGCVKRARVQVGNGAALGRRPHRRSRPRTEVFEGKRAGGAAGADETGRLRGAFQCADSRRQRRYALLSAHPACRQVLRSGSC